MTRYAIAGPGGSVRLGRARDLWDDDPWASWSEGLDRGETLVSDQSRTMTGGSQ